MLFKNNGTKYTTFNDSYDEHIQNQHCLHINRLEARSVLIPALHKGVYYKNKEESEFLMSLNGDWDFYYCSSDAVCDFYKEDYDTSAWDTIDVPSMWQYRGYGKCTYPNVKYPIPFNPPYVCCENPVGYYKRTFTVENPSDRTILHFGGVDNAFYVYINGCLAGFSKGSRIPAEFDVSSLLHSGKNTISVKVYTYSDSTYLENQDMLMANGIFRDVYLLCLNQVSLWDYRVTTTMNSICINAELEYSGEPDFEVRFTLGEKSVILPLEKNVSHTFELENPKFWNAEEPNLYDLTIEVLKDGTVLEIHSKRVGIMHTKVIGNKFYVNGSPIYIKGINRHEYDCKNGRAISVELIEKELKLIKENNINAIRCSHYTNNPAFYEIASELGIYVMDEADLETHGASDTGDQGYLSKDPEWLDAYLDRVKRMLKVNKNEPCIFIWSLGNECGRGENINRCFEYAKSFDPTKEIIYSQEEPYYPEYSNFSRIGYRPISCIESFAETGHPLMLIEYAHAMGNSPGFSEGYWDYIYTHENACGGFVWEFKNHGFYTIDEKGREYYLYGGDFDDNEKYHWYNFNLDGYLTSDGTPKPTWYELGEAMAPVYVSFENGIKITNTNDFKTLDYLTVKWELCEDYTAVKSGEMQLPAISAHESVNFDSAKIDYVPNQTVPGAKYYLNLYFYDSKRRIASRQLLLPCYEAKSKAVSTAPECKFFADGDVLTVCGDNFEVSVQNGVICRYAKNNKLLIDKPMQMSFYRATNDNDGIMAMTRWFPNWFYRRAGEWDRAYLKTMKFNCEKTTAEKTDTGVCIISDGRIIADFEWLGFEANLKYTIMSDGSILTELHCRPFGKLPEVMPRMGVCFELPGEFNKAEWYGRGLNQSYSDCTLAAPIGLYEADVTDMNFIFDVPQDTGNHENTAFVSVSDGSGNGLSITGCDEFSFSYHDFTLDSLNDAKHRNELEKSKNNYLYIDYKMRGLGSHSCGPEPEEPFELRPHEFRLAFVLSDLKSNEDALKSARTNFGAVTGRLSEDYSYEEIQKESEVADCKE